MWVHRGQTQSKVSTIDEQYPKVMNPRNEALLERSQWIAVRKSFLKKGNKQKSLTNDIFGSNHYQYGGQKRGTTVSSVKEALSWLGVDI